MITPRFLTSGDTVGIVSTARKITAEELTVAVDLLDQWGLNVSLGRTVGAVSHQFAGSDEERRADLQQMLDNPEVKAIWFARGGYGTVRIVDGLDFTRFLEAPKWLMGYSDITVLHSQIHKLGVETLHAQMPLELEKKSVETVVSLQNGLFGIPPDLEYSSENNLNRRGTTSGQLVGGNLSVLYSLCGSPSALNTEGKILFLEDLDEYLYHIDRMMQNLKRNGYLDRLAGLIVGGMTQMHDNTIPFGSTAEQIIREVAEAYDFPIALDFPAGHITDNRTLIFGRKVSLEIDENRVQLKF